LTNRPFTPDDPFALVFQDPSRLGAEPALEILKGSLARALSFHSRVIDFYQNAFAFAFLPGNLLDAAAQVMEFSLALQRSWTHLLTSYVDTYVGGATASGSGALAVTTAEPVERCMDFAHCMDIAIGQAAGGHAAQDRVA
jgi:hypothetical protein